MKIPIKILLLFLFINCNQSSSQVNCYNKVVKEEWNLNICLDSEMGIDMSNHEFILLRKNSVENDTITQQTISIFSRINEEKFNIEKLWEIKIGVKIRNESNSYLEIDKNVYSKGANESLIKVIENEGSVFLTAIIIYKNRYFLLKSIDRANDKDSFKSFKELLNRLSFEGEIIRLENNSVDKIFITSLAESLSDENSFKKLLITDELLRNSLSENNIDALNQIEKSIPDWNKGAIGLYHRFKACNSKITISDIDIKREKTSESIINMLFSVNIKCENVKNVDARFMAFQIDNNIYIGRMIIE